MGRPPKNQDTSHLKYGLYIDVYLRMHHMTRPIGSYFQSDSSSSSSAYVLSNSKTRLISSYFQSNSKSAAEPSPSRPQSTRSNSPCRPDQATLSTDAIKYEDVDSDTIKSDTGKDETPTKTDLFDEPFTSQEYETATEEFYDGQTDDNNPFSLNNPFSPSKPTIKEIKSPWNDDGLDAELGPIDNIDSLGLMTYSSQPSGESLRRLALSPRKQKIKKDLLPGSVSMPTQTFSEKLAAEMSDSDRGDTRLLCLSKTRSPIFALKKEDALLSNLKKPTAPDFDIKEEDAELSMIEGSDPESEADWNDDEIRKPFPAVSTVSTVAAVASPPKLTVGDVDALLESDDDIPTLGRFTTKNAKFVLDESESDLDDDPFSSNSSELSTPSTTTTASLDQSKEKKSIDAGVSGDENDLKDTPMRRTTRTTIRATTPPRKGRILRSSTTKRALSPISPPRPAPKPAKKKPALFSLDSLLNEKKRRAQIGYDLEAAKNQMVLNDELIEEYNEDEEEDSFYGPDAIPKGILSEEQEGALTEIIGDEQIEIIEDVAEFFVRWPQELVVQPLEPELNDADFGDPVVQKAVKCTRTDIQRTQFLTSPFLMIISSSPWAMPRSLFRWLVHVVSVEQNQAVTLSVFALLQRTFSQRTSLLGVDHQDLIRAFKTYGAKEEYLEQDWKVTPVTRTTRSERLILPDTKKFPRQNLKAVIKLVNMTATLDPQFYQVVEIRKILNLLLRITTDPIIGDIKSLLGSTMVALLDAIPAGSWESERHILCEEIIQTLGTSLPFMLLVLHQLPSLSMRITLLRRSIAVAYLNQPRIPGGEIAPNLEELHRALFVDRGFLINSETVYRDLGRRIQVFGFCLDDEQMIANYGRKALEPLLKKLRLMHGKIVDVRAAFMERTWAKDMIQRLYMRLYYAGIHRQIAKQSTLNFGMSASGEKQRPQDPSATDQHSTPESTLSSASVKVEETLQPLSNNS
ncbi:hypothetical protein BGX20_000321 [Mortierella sp. AD010]|nr:hypothetical protein BGX20_000321 [Mortierella sp. AD010]